jgi:predicted nucleic acid-binding protein
MALAAFLDTSVLIAGLVDFGPQSAPAQEILHAVAERTLAPAGTAWHCCLECFSVSTRLPSEYRLAPAEAAQLLEQEVFGRLAVYDLPAGDRVALLKAAAQEAVAGGRIYDTHIAEVARAAGAAVIVTDNRRHFVAALRHGIRVETPLEFAAALKRQRSRKPGG